MNRAHKRIIDRINKSYSDNVDRTIEELVEKYHSTENLTEKLALIKCVIFKTTGFVVYDEQIYCAINIIQGRAVEMRTGEGKSLAALMSGLYIGSIHQVYICTVNDYLARRDYETFKHVYETLNLKVSHNSEDMTVMGNDDKSNVYDANVIYTSGQSLIFDYLRCTISRTNFNMEFAILDEIDFILLDNANSSFSISVGASEVDVFEETILRQVNNIFKEFIGGEIPYKIDKLNYKYINTLDLDYVYTTSDHKSYITTQGETKILSELGIDGFTDNLIMYKSIVNMLEAYCFYTKGIDYIVQDGKLTIINHANGRTSPNSKLGDGLHNALEAKEGLKLTSSGGKTITSSYQVFFSKFTKLAGMSGTIMSEYKEMKELYSIESVKVPLHNKDKCVRHQPKYFKTKEEKYRYMLGKVKEKRKNRQPILIICENEVASNIVSETLFSQGIQHNLLNNEYTDEEENIINSSGKAGAVTVSTNMAGRGTDIVITKEADKLGGLYVITLTNYESIRIENQIKGRAGRQGFHGEFQLISSLDDTIWSELKLETFTKIEKLSNKKFYSKFYQRKLSKLMDNIREFKNLRNSNIRKTTFYKQNIIETMKQYVFNYASGFENTDEFIQATVSREIEKEEFITNVKEAFNIENMPSAKAEKVKFISQLLTEKLKYPSEDYTHLIKTLYDNNTIEEWYEIQNQLEQYGSTILTPGNYYNGGQDKFVTGSKKIIDGYLSSISIEIIDKMLSVEKIEGEKNNG